MVEAPVIHNQNDIIRVIARLDPNKSLDVAPIDVSQTIKTHDDNGRQVNVGVKSKVQPKTDRMVIINALKSHKEKMSTMQQLEDKYASVEPPIVNGRPMQRVVCISGVINDSIDSMIYHLTGGHRNGMYVMWRNVDGFDYRYDIINHALSRAKCDAS